MSLASVTRGTPPRPPGLVIYGPHGIGKTTFACRGKNPIVLRTEDGLGSIAADTFPLCTSFPDVISALGTLYTEPHAYETLVVDSLDWLEPLIWAATCRRMDKASIEDFGYGRGYIEADVEWKQLLAGLTALRDKGLTIVCLAHAEIRRFDAPDTDPYDTYQIKLHRRAAALVQEWADLVGFAHYEVHTVAREAGFNKEVTRGVGVGRRLLSCEERPAYRAKNRFGISQDLPLDWQALMSAVAASYAGRVNGSASAPLRAPSAAPTFADELEADAARDSAAMALNLPPF